MTDQGSPSRPPLGSWPRTYALVAVAAIATILLLYWLTATFDLGAVK